MIYGSNVMHEHSQQPTDSERAPADRGVRRAFGWTVARLFCALLFAAMGVVLLVAGKSVAGAACIASACFLVAPLERLISNRRLALAVRASLVALLSLVAIVGIAGTDIVPDQAVTGYKFVDQLLAIFRRFGENVGG